MGCKGSKVNVYDNNNVNKSSIKSNAWTTEAVSNKQDNYIDTNKTDNKDDINCVDTNYNNEDIIRSYNICCSIYQFKGLNKNISKTNIQLHLKYSDKFHCMTFEKGCDRIQIMCTAKKNDLLEISLIDNTTTNNNNTNNNTNNSNNNEVYAQSSILFDDLPQYNETQSLWLPLMSNYIKNDEISFVKMRIGLQNEGENIILSPTKLELATNNNEKNEGQQPEVGKWFDKTNKLWLNTEYNEDYSIFCVSGRGHLFGSIFTTNQTNIDNDECELSFHLVNGGRFFGQISLDGSKLYGYFYSCINQYLKYVSFERIE